MKTKDREQLKAMSAPEMASELKKRSDELFKMTFGQVGVAVKNPLRERTLRREIAMLHTWIRQKEQEERPRA